MSDFMNKEKMKTTMIETNHENMYAEKSMNLMNPAVGDVQSNKINIYELAARMISSFPAISLEEGNYKCIKKDPPEMPAYVSVEKKYSLIREEDDDYFQNVRKAYKKYNSSKGKENEDQSLEELSQLCRSYGFLSFNNLKWGKGMARIEEMLDIEKRVNETQNGVNSL